MAWQASLMGAAQDTAIGWFYEAIGRANMLSFHSIYIYTRTHEHTSRIELEPLDDSGATKIQFSLKLRMLAQVGREKRDEEVEISILCLRIHNVLVAQKSLCSWQFGKEEAAASKKAAIFKARSSSTSLLTHERKEKPF